MFQNWLYQATGSRSILDSKENKNKYIHTYIVHITIDFKDIKRIIKTYYKPLYANKFNNLDEMDTIENLNNPTTTKENKPHNKPPYK